MPAPGRGVAVLAVGPVSSVGSGSCTITIAGEALTLPYVNTPTDGSDAWVLFDGRTGLVLGAVVT